MRRLSTKPLSDHSIHTCEPMHPCLSIARRATIFEREKNTIHVLCMHDRDWIRRASWRSNKYKEELHICPTLILSRQRKIRKIHLIMSSARLGCGRRHRSRPCRITTCCAAPCVSVRCYCCGWIGGWWKLQCVGCALGKMANGVLSVRASLPLCISLRKTLERFNNAGRGACLLVLPCREVFQLSIWMQP